MQGGVSCSFVSQIAVIKYVNRTFGGKMRRKWFVLLTERCENNSQELWLFFAVFFFHEVVKLHLCCGGLCIFPVSAFSIIFFCINVPL